MFYIGGDIILKEGKSYYFKKYRYKYKKIINI